MSIFNLFKWIIWSHINLDREERTMLQLLSTWKTNVNFLKSKEKSTKTIPLSSHLRVFSTPIVLNHVTWQKDHMQFKWGEWIKNETKVHSVEFLCPNICIQPQQEHRSINVFTWASDVLTATNVCMNAIDNE